MIPRLPVNDYHVHTLGGRIGKVVASHAAVARAILLRCTDLYYARGAQGVLPRPSIAPGLGLPGILHTCGLFL